MPEVLDRETIKALSTDTRQDIMKMLAKRPYTASEISKITGKHVTTVSEHLDVLEKTGLIRKKDSTNKWIYYELSDKGEHLFKPQFYSWVVVLSLSFLFIFIGALRMMDFSLSSNTAGTLADNAPMMVQKAASEAIPAASQTPAAIAAGIDILGIGLIALGAIGLSYLAYRKFTMSRNMQIKTA